MKFIQLPKYRGIKRFFPVDRIIVFYAEDDKVVFRFEDYDMEFVLYGVNVDTVKGFFYDEGMTFLSFSDNVRMEIKV